MNKELDEKTIYQALKTLDICCRNKCRHELKNKYFVNLFEIINKLTKEGLKQLGIKIIIWIDDPYYERYYDCLEILDNYTYARHIIPVPVLEGLIGIELNYNNPIFDKAVRDNMEDGYDMITEIICSDEMYEVAYKLQTDSKFIEEHSGITIPFKALKMIFNGIVIYDMKEFFKTTKEKIKVRDCIEGGRFFNIVKKAYGGYRWMCYNSAATAIMYKKMQ